MYLKFLDSFLASARAKVAIEVEIHVRTYHIMNRIRATEALKRIRKM